MEAAGFASAIITFVEFSYKLVNGSITAYESGTGLVDQDVTRVVNDLEAVTKAIDVASIEAASGLHWVELRELAIACNSLSNELVLILQKARRRQDGNRALRSFGAAWASLRSSKDVMEIQRKLNEYRAQILLRLSLILDGRQQWIAKQLEELQTGNARYFKTTVTEFETLQTTVKGLESRLSRQVLGDQRMYDPKQDHSNTLAEIQAELSRISRVINSSALKNAATDVLKRLRFETIYSRVDHIGDGEFQFFSWLFNEDQEVDQSLDDGGSFVRAHGLGKITSEARERARVAVTQWLEVGDNVLHISGKAGSGKSILMKRLSLDPGLKKKLERWFGDKTPVLASFFFWGTGHDQQNSLEGLYRSLLYEVLMQYPELTSVAFPKFTSVHNLHPTARGPFRLMELRQALANLIEAENALTNHCFCFFIDGLDEYNGDAADHVALALQLRKWAEFSNVKICASSRPHPEFHSIFDEGARMCLHKLTGSDIHRYALKAFQNCPGMEMSQERLDKIAATIVWKAEGVFLWARLAIPALLGHLQHSVDEPEVHSQLEQLPSNLDSLFMRIFDSISASERTHAYRLLLIVLQRARFTAIALSWIDDLKDVDFPFNRPRRSCSDEEALSRVAQVEHQLKLYCKGLLELRQNGHTSNYFKYDVEFMHRSFYDFLKQPDTISSMTRHLRSFSTPNLYPDSQRLILATLKFARWDPGFYDFDCTWEHHAMHDFIFSISCGGTSRFLDELEFILDCSRVEIANKIEASPEQPETYQSLRKETPHKGRTSWGQYVSLDLVYVRPHYDDMGVSLPHCFAQYCQMNVLVERLRQRGTGYYDKKGLCMIFPALFGIQSTTMIQGLLDLGVRTSDGISLWTTQNGEPFHQLVPFWAIVAMLICQDDTRPAVRAMSESGFYPGLEVLLRAGMAPNPDLRVEFYDHGDSVFFSFEELIIHRQPANSDILIRELRRLSWRGWVGQLMGRAGSFWSPNTTTMTSSGPLPESKIGKAAWFNADGSSTLRRVWVGADKFDVSADAAIRMA